MAKARFDQIGMWNPVLWLALLLVLLRLPVALKANQGLVMNIDEALMALSSLDRFLGVPNVEMNWPGGTLQLLMAPILAMTYLIQSKFSLSTDGFLTFLSEAYRSPWHTIFLVRLLVTCISSFGLASLFYPLSVVSKNAPVRLASLLMGATLPFIWIYSHMATVDALSLGFVCASLTFLGFPKLRSGVYLAGIAFGFALGAKLTFVLSFPFLIAFLLVHSHQPQKDLVRYLVTTFLGFVFACPYVWTEPIRLAKAVFGLSTQQGQQQSLWEIFNLLSQIISAPMACVFALGIVSLFIRKQSLLLLGSSLTFIFSLIIFSRAHGIVFDRYFMPCLPAFLFVLASGLDVLMQGIQQLRLDPAKIKFLTLTLLFLIVSVVLTNHINAYAASIKQAHRDQNIKIQIFDDIKSLNCQKSIMVPFELFNYISNGASAASLEAMRTKAIGVKLKDVSGSYSSISRKSMDADVIKFLGQNFNENERAHEARLRIMAYTEPSHGLAVQLWHKYRGVNERFGFPSPEEVYQSIRDKRVCAAILPVEVMPEIGSKGKNYGPYNLVIPR